MKKRNILFIPILVLFLLSCDDQVTDVLSKEEIEENIRYYPLEVGNFWIYDISHSGNFFSETKNYIVKKEVLFTINTPNEFYYIKETPFQNGESISSDNSFYKNTSYRRIDKTTGIVKSYRQSLGESDWMNLMMGVGEIEERGSDTGYWKREVKSEEDNEILGVTTTVKSYYTQDAFQGYTHEFAKDIGLIRYQLNGEYDRYNLILKGAKIDDVVIGDTTTTDLKKRIC